MTDITIKLGKIRNLGTPESIAIDRDIETLIMRINDLRTSEGLRVAGLVDIPFRVG